MIDAVHLVYKDCGCITHTGDSGAVIRRLASGDSGLTYETVDRYRYVQFPSRCTLGHFSKLGAYPIQVTEYREAASTKYYEPKKSHYTFGKGEYETTPGLSR